jgi:hypothetical protein
MSDAYKAGYERGEASGSWVIDGNTTETTAQRILKGINEGDPEVMDMQPAPLSGEWAGESIPALSDLYGLDLFDDEVATEFEDGFTEGFWSVVESDAALIADRGET